MSEPPTTAQSPSADPARTPAEAAFDRDWYLGAYPDVAAAGVDPFEHYKRHGKGEGRHPTAAAAEAALGFDRDWYLRAYSDVAAAAVDPVEHYKMYGKGEGRHPTQASAEEAIGFDRAWYLAAYPDVAAAGVDPFDHYRAYGKAEGRHSNAHFSFSPRQLGVLAKSYHYKGCETGSATEPTDDPPPAQSVHSFGSAQYWRDRYRTGGNSGAGSYGRLASFKAEIINAFVREHNITSVIEFGCGDGAQLALADYPTYLGFDVADESIQLCQSRFARDPSKEFRNSASWDYERADLTLSLDVIFHLIEDDVFHEYMRRLFLSAERYVIVYSSNHEGEQPAAHVKHRRFTDWVEIYHPNFMLVRHIPNRWPLVDDDQSQSFADFFIFEKLPTRKHMLPGHLVVSLTSYRKRFPTLELTLRRILQQSVQPDETVLWLAEEDRERLPEGVLALQRCGLTIRITRDIRSYKKIVPALEYYPRSFIITLDDDIAYPLDTIEPLVVDYRTPTEILCRRAHKITYDTHGKLLPYSQWQYHTLDESGPDLFPTGGGGALYPPRTLALEVLEEPVFSTLAPLADDVWLFWMGRLAGSAIRRVGGRYLLQLWPGCDEQGLWVNHNANGGNDRAIAALATRYGMPFGHGPVNAPDAGTGGNGSPSRALFACFAWSEPSAARNELTCRYEPFQPFLFIEFAAAAECDLVLDIGANIGAYSLLSTRAPTVESVQAFEAEEAAFAELKYNVLLNRLENKIASHFIAASNRSGFVNFGVVRPMAGNNGVIETSIHARDVYGETRQIPSAALDTLLSPVGRSIALKIDVEGHEHSVLEGCKKLLTGNKCIVQIEIYEENSRIYEFFHGIGYRNVIKIGHDHYFSNNDRFYSSDRVLQFVESAMAQLIDFSLKS